MSTKSTLSLKDFSNHQYYSEWALHLHATLQDSYIERAQSFDKDTLYIQFAKKNFRQCIEFKVCDGYLLIFKSIKDLASTNPKKGQLQFKELENSKVQGVYSIYQDRQLFFEFSSRKRLWIKGFGKFSNVLLQEFNIDKNTWHPNPSGIFRLGNKSDWDFIFNEEIITSNVVTEIDEQSLNERIKHLEESSLNAFRDFLFQYQKNTRIKRLEQRLQQLHKLLKESNIRIENLKLKRSNKEIGDLILAHAHSLKPGISKALVTDYYTQQRIWIKLNPDLNAADNAKKYYGKAKNEIIESQKLEENINHTVENIKSLEAELYQIRKINTLKELKPLKNETSNKKNDTLPYKEIDINGFTLWIGKNAKSNDEVLRLSSKNDLWLHAKDFTGSHVIVRKRGVDYPKDIIEEAARLAAINSKAKSQSVIPVIFTQRKFVSKIKGGLTGQVSVQKESIIDVYLK
jgi:predicted ribosome quality control (RQC) complex YloA/Tae2 family protein